MYFKDVNHFNHSIRKAMDKGAKQGVAEVNKKVKLQTKNDQRKRDLAKKIKGRTPAQKEEHHEKRHWRRMNEEGDRTAADYQG